MHEERQLTIGEVVTELQPYYPDLTISSIRFLEREGLVTPQRTTGGHRLFTKQDMDRIRHIKDLQRRRYSLEEIRQHLNRASEATTLQAITDEYLHFILAGERTQALNLMMSTVHTDVTAKELYLNVITPAMARIGILWQQGKVSIAQEHLASSISRDAVALLKEHLATKPANGLRAVAACPPGELHELGIKVASDLFECAGWYVSYLGANTPIETLLDFIEQRRPHLLLLSVGFADVAWTRYGDYCRGTARAGLLGPVVIGVGGPTVKTDAPEWLNVGADFLSEHADDAIEKATALVTRVQRAESEHHNPVSGR